MRETKESLTHARAGPTQNKSPASRHSQSEGTTVQKYAKRKGEKLRQTPRVAGSPFTSLWDEQSRQCWATVFTTCLTLSRVCEYVGTLEHTHFSDSVSQPPLTIHQPQKTPGSSGLLGELEFKSSSQEQSLEQGPSLNTAPVVQPHSIQELVRECSRGRTSDFRGGSLSGSSAAKVVLSLSTQADRYARPASPEDASAGIACWLRLC